MRSLRLNETAVRASNGALSLGVNSVVLSFGSYVAQAASAAAYVAAARYLEPSQFGVVIAGIGVELVLAMTADFGLNAWTVRRLALGDDATTFTETVGAKALIATGLGVAWLLVVVLLFGKSGSFLALELMALYLVLNIFSTTFAVPFRAFEKMATVGVVTSVDKLVALLATVVLFRARIPGGAGLVLGLAVGSAISLGSYAYLVGPGFRRITLTSPNLVRELWKSSAGFGIFGLAAYVQRLDTAVVALVAGGAAAGMYGAPARLSTFLGVLPASFSLAMFSRFARDPQRASNRRDAIASGLALLCAFGLVLMLAFVFAPEAITALAGSRYASSVPVLRVYLFAIGLAALSQPLAALLQAKNDELYTARILAGADLLGLAGIAIGARLVGPVGAAIGSVFMQLLIAGGMVVRVRHSERPSATSPQRNTVDVDGKRLRA